MKSKREMTSSPTLPDRQIHFKDVSSKTDVKLFSIGTHIVPILKSCKNVIYILWDFDWLDLRS